MRRLAGAPPPRQAPYLGGPKAAWRAQFGPRGSSNESNELHCGQIGYTCAVRRLIGRASRVTSIGLPPSCYCLCALVQVQVLVQARAWAPSRSLAINSIPLHFVLRQNCAQVSPPVWLFLPPSFLQPFDLSNRNAIHWASFGLASFTSKLTALACTNRQLDHHLNSHTHNCGPFIC